jgi:hypothetical protein
VNTSVIRPIPHRGYLMRTSVCTDVALVR